MFNVAHNDKSKTILQNPCPNSQALTKAQDEAAASTDAAAAADNSIPLTQQTQDSLTLICGSGGDGGVHDVIHHLQQKHGSTHRDTQQKQRAAQSMPSLQQPNRKRPRTDNRINASIPCTTSPNKNCQHDSRVVRTVGNDPNFLASFFANSRLSFIGGYQQRLVAQQQQHQPIDKQTTIHNHNTQQQEHQQRWVMHVDMDCFFCAVALRNMPASYQNKPVAISHQGKNNNNNSDNPHHRRNNDNNTNSTSECATCNYHARACGVTKGMYLGRAKQLCPDLIVLPYDFEGIAEVANQVATILQEWALKHDGLVQIVSCDEAFVQVHVPITCNDGLQDESTTLQHWATHIRHKIFSATQCTATVGVGPNKLIAKLATDHVKPNQCLVVRDYERLLQSLRVRQLPGVGAHREQQLIDHGIVWVKDVWDLGHKALETLVASLGPTNGKNVYLACHGQDDRLVQPEDPLTIGAECNYGVRFDGPYGVDYMLAGLAQELEKRMEQCAVKGLKVTLKIKQRQQGAGPPRKFLGHGVCDNRSKSRDVPEVTRHWVVLQKLCLEMLASLSVEKEDIRGMGITVSKLVKDSDCGPKNSITRWLVDKNVTNSDATNKSLKDTSGSCGRCSDDAIDIDVFKGTVTANEAGHNSTKKGSQFSNEIDAAVSSDYVQNTEDDELVQTGSPALGKNKISQVPIVPSPVRKQSLAKTNAAKSRRQNKTKKVAPLRKERLLQTNVERMFRLQALKDGGITIRGETISRAELENLPIEIQLQIANEDDRKLGYASATMRGVGANKKKRLYANNRSEQANKRTPPRKSSPVKQSRR